MSAPLAAVSAGWVFSLGELAQILDGQLEGPALLQAESYALDSRAVRPGTVFFALKGQRTDGHRFLDQLLGRGAAAVVAGDAVVPAGLACVRVADPALALARLGREFREHWPIRVVGITGSAGKTTTKDFAATLLADRFRILKSEGNLNTTLGLPLTLARRRPNQVAVLELGMSFPGELRRVAAIAGPDVAVVTNVGLAHIGNFHSADDVARAKAEILEEVRPGGIFVANADDTRVMAMAAGFRGPSVTFGLDHPADVRALDVTPVGPVGTRFTVECGGKHERETLPVVGLHHVRNVLAALAVGHALGVDPLELLTRFSALAAAEHRGRVERLKGDVLLIDDCYNSSPTALTSALEALASLPAERRVAVLGDMLELGEYTEVSHREAGRQAALRADVVIGVGPESALLVEEAVQTGCREVRHVPDAATAAEVVPVVVRDGDAVLVKGSRGIGLEVVVEALKQSRG